MAITRAGTSRALTLHVLGAWTFLSSRVSIHSFMRTVQTAVHIRPEVCMPITKESPVGE